MSTSTGPRIRMYRVGFGDCFLLSVPDGADMQHILIDCGVHPSGDIGTLEAVVNNIAEETDKKLALVIATHAHVDHISGFATQQNVFRRFQVREVWMPWTEDPQDEVAARLKKQHMSLVEALVKHFAAKPASDHVCAALESLKVNDAALSLLRSGINGGVVTYVQAGKRVDNVAGIAGLSVCVLAPPRDEAFLAQMDPPVDERFLRATSDGEWELVEETRPFDNSWQVEADSSHPYYRAIDDREKNLLAVAATSGEMLALTLDQIVNNTSIVALFTFRGKRLLFAADAQYGNWKSWIEQADGKAQLANLSFYKVAHHGSFNATPKSALNAMPAGSFAAMVSTQSRPWANIPQSSLMKAIAAKSSGMVRSDSIRISHALAGPTVSQLPAGFEQGAYWFDYYLPV